MSKKSIGQFIAALRKANGMTQKQLGQLLNVSDKAVSRWERDECAPDLSLIPAIAEIFSVTSDEILRGERLMQDGDTVTAKDNAKTEKQIENLLNNAKAKFNAKSMISIGIGITGILAAMIANLGFNRAYIGFFSGSILILAALVCESIFVQLTFSSVNSTDLNSESVNTVKEQIFAKALITYAVIITCFASTLPLIYIPEDTYMGVTVQTCLIHGLICVASSTVISAILIWIVKWFAFKKGVYQLSEENKSKYIKLHHLKKRCMIYTAAVIFITFIIQIAFNSSVSPSSFVKGQEFTDMNKFKQYMETETPAIDYYNNQAILSTMPIAEDEFDYDDYGMTPENDYDKNTIEDSDGNVIFSFEHKNLAVVQYSISEKDGTTVVTAYTSFDLQQGCNIIDIINMLFVVLYVGEVLCAVLIYKNKSKIIIE